MIRLLYTFLIICGCCLAAQGQVQNTGQTTNTTSSRVTSYDQKMATVKSCPELNEQLTKLFGKDFTISDPKVNAQLEKNIADKNASTCIRKKSLYGIYGEDYINHLHLINNTANTNSNTKTK